MPIHINLTGRRFGRLIAMKTGQRTTAGRIRWICRCDCGSEALVEGDKLRKGNTKSCGCLRAEMTAAKNTTHGYAGPHRLAEYRAWAQMLTRCYNPNRPEYPNYGGRGIAVCDRWRNSFENFFADMGLKPAPHYTLDRWPDNDAGYSPHNCRWATRKQQAANKRPCKAGPERGADGRWKQKKS